MKLKTHATAIAMMAFTLNPVVAQDEVATPETTVPAETAATEVAPTEPAAPEAAPADMKKVSYILGTSVAKSMKRDGMEIDLDEFMSGFKEILGGGTSAIPEAEEQSIMMAWQAEMQAKQEATMKTESAENIEKGKAFLEENGKREGVTTTATGLQYEVITKGEGAVPTPADTVRVHYHGTLLDGKVFDSSVERGDSITFGVTQVIPGWTEGLQLMNVGSKYKLFIPSDLAYGERGAGQDIAPHSALVFEVELIGIE